MSKETELEVIKALAYDENIESIANMAEADISEIKKIREKYADEISDRRRDITEAMEHGN